MTSAKAVSFLSKKSWHTGTMRSMEKVWQAEEKNREEEKKLNEWRRELIEEKEVESLRRMQEKETGQRKEMVDFLYQQPVGIDDTDEAMNVPFKDKEAASEVKQLTAQPGALWLSKEQITAEGLNDLRNKIREDPLFAIKREQKNLKDKIKSNPVKMEQLRQQLEDMKKDKKRKHKHGKDKRSKKRKTGSEEAVWVEKTDKKSDKHRSVKAEVKPEVKAEVKPERDERRFDRSERDERVRERRDWDERRDRDDRRDRGERDRRDDRDEPRYRDDRRTSVRDRKDDRRDDRDRQDSRDDRRDDRDRHYRSERERDNNKESDRRGATTDNKKSASKKKMTAEERQKLLEEMENTAKVQREERAEKVKQRQEDRIREHEELRKVAEAEGSGRSGFGPSFLSSMSKNVFEEGSTASVEDRVKRARFYRQKGSEDSGFL